MIIAQITDTHIKAEGRIAYKRVDTLARAATEAVSSMASTGA